MTRNEQRIFTKLHQKVNSYSKTKRKLGVMKVRSRTYFGMKAKDFNMSREEFSTAIRSLKLNGFIIGCNFKGINYYKLFNNETNK